MKASELRDLGVDELGARERDLTDQIFRMRIQKSMGQLEVPNKIVAVRRDLARVKTVLQAETAARLGIRVWLTRVKSSASSSATRCRRASSSPSSGRCGTGSTARPSGARRSSWCTTRRTRPRIGDTVEIVETRPMSRRKRWALKRVVRQAAEV